MSEIRSKRSAFRAREGNNNRNPTSSKADKMTCWNISQRREKLWERFFFFSPLRLGRREGEEK